MSHRVIAHERRPDPEEHLERNRNVVAVITIEIAGNIVDRELSAEPDIDPAAMRQIAHVSDRVSIDREDPLFIDRIEHQFMARLLDVLEPRVKRIAPALVIRLHQDRLRVPRGPRRDSAPRQTSSTSSRRDRAAYYI